MVYSDESGAIFDDPGVEMAGSSAGQVQRVDPAALVPLPEGSDLLAVPGHFPLGYDLRNRRLRAFRERRAVAAFLAPAHTRHLNPAMGRGPDAGLLPLYAYTAVGWKDGRFWVPAERVDPDPRQDPAGFDLAALPKRIDARLLAASGSRRYLEHLRDCALERQCPAARNFFLGRWEAPLPTSPRCNARCVGCISEQPEGRTQTFGRIAFQPSVAELLDVALPHIEHAPRPVVSFGQGCEGEPLLAADVIEESVRALRQRTSGGVVNLNTNGSRPARVERIAAAGLDAIRISLPAVTPRIYDAYTLPAGFRQDDVLESLRVAHAAGVHTSLNYFVFPGVSDRAAEEDALLALCATGLVDMIQLRNLNIDPQLYLEALGPLDDLGPARGVGHLIGRLRREAPQVRLGYFNPYDLRLADGRSRRSERMP